MLLVYDHRAIIANAYSPANIAAVSTGATRGWSNTATW